MHQTFKITGMTCAACVSHIEKAVSSLSGINEVRVNLVNNTMRTDYDENLLTQNDIIKAVVRAGYGASADGVNTSQSSVESLNDDEQRSMLKRFVTSLIFLLPLFYISMGHMWGWPLPASLLGAENSLNFAFLQFLLVLPIIYVNQKYYISGIRSILNRAPNMDALVAIGSAAAIIYGIYSVFMISDALGAQDFASAHEYSMRLYFESAAMILTLVTLGKYLETRSKAKTAAAISSLINLAPKSAKVVRNNLEIETDVNDLIIGDIVIIRPGEIIPADGEIVFGMSSVDESMLTGESVPVYKEEGAKVFTGTLNTTGTFKFKVTSLTGDRALDKIIALVEEAASSKAPVSRLADRVSGIFVPIVVCIAVITAVIWLISGYEASFALTAGISVLVISCPCALGLATPVAIMAGTGAGAKTGILIKSAAALELLGKTNVAVFDKTGTLTEGRPTVTDIITDSLAENQLLSLFASLESSSEHPLSLAVINEAKRRSVDTLPVTSFESIPGRGIKGVISEETYYAGNLSLMNENNLDICGFDRRADEFTKNGKTPLYFASHEKVLGIIFVADTIKEQSKNTVLALRNRNIDVVLLTGDTENTAKSIASQLGIDKVISQVLPKDKESHIRTLKENGKIVAMIGDGINDAPALMRADIGFALGAGTDVAIESADIVLMHSDPYDTVRAIDLSRKVMRIIRQNLFWAFFYNCIGIPIAAGALYAVAGVQLSPMIAAAAMSLSSVCVVSNALRLRAVNRKEANQSKTTNIQKAVPTETANIKEENIMKREILIEGMMCKNCVAHVSRALNALEGVTADVQLDTNTAYVDITGDVSDDTLKNAVIDAGYEVVNIK